MGTTLLRQFLQSLCCSSCWNYAAFWKLQIHGQMVLTWEDEYSDNSTPWKSMEGISGDVLLKGSETASSSNCEPCINDEKSAKLVVSGTSNFWYPLGQGVVGEVAYTGKYFWIFHDVIVAGEFNSDLVPGYPDELFLQFVAGIQTTLLVPVVPYGVLQLGSLEKVSENLEMVADIKHKFYTHQNLVGYSVPLTPCTGIFARSSSLMSFAVENLDGSSFITLNETGPEDLKVAGDVKITSNNVSSSTQMTPLPMVEIPLRISGKDVLNFLSLKTEDNTNCESVGFVEVSEHVNCSTNCNRLGLAESDMFKFSCPEEEFAAFSYCNNNAIGDHGEYANKVNLFSDGIVMEHAYAIMGSNHTGVEYLSNSTMFPFDSEMHKALGRGPIGIDGYLWDSSISGEHASDDSSFICDENLFCGPNTSVWDSSVWFSGVEGAAPLFEDVFINSCSNLNSNLYDQPDCELYLSPSELLFATSKEQSPFEESALVKEDTSSWSCVSSVTAARGRATANFSPSASSLESVVGIDVGGRQKMGHDFLHVRKGSKPSGISKRRARPSTGRRCRPRDRQLIQDRLKELRELVPNGSKYSIDGLLDQTINHMLFLRSVTDQADKLQQWVHQEEGKNGNTKSSQSMPDCQSGASWALELGSEKQIWPMVVKDLEYPGHMKIEMMCNDDRRFLEIADVILRLELTILTGIMKRCSEDIWAHFVVEAPQGFRRMDIFWPLMQLLQQNRLPVSSKI